MRYASFLHPDGSARFGRIESGELVDLGPGSLRAALADGSIASRPDGDRFSLASVTLLPVIPDPARILCVGFNYADHVKEMGRTATGYPGIFTRWSHSLVAHGAPLVRPRESERLDYEGELAVIIGKPGRRILPEHAMHHIAGFAPFLDGSVRDWQRHNSQFTPGKNFPGTGGFGPAMVTPEEAGPIADLRVQTRLNGELMQDQPVTDLIHDIPALIAYISTFTPLEPGDVIATGTPSGVGDARQPPVYLKQGDVVEVSIGPVGTLVHPVVDEG